MTNTAANTIAATVADAIDASTIVAIDAAIADAIDAIAAAIAATAAASCDSSVASERTIADIIRHMLICRGVENALVEWRDRTGVNMDAELSAAWRVIMARQDRQYVNARVALDRLGAGGAIRTAGL